VAIHAEDALGCARISQILDLPFAVATSEARATERLITREDGKILDLVSAGIAAVRAIVAYQRAVAKKEQIRVGVE
jgi:hypothetical protein